MHRLSPLLLTILAIATALVGCEKVPVKPESKSPAASTTPEAATITVFAAASTVDVMNEAARLFREQKNVEVKCSFDSSSTLAKQIMAGAPADAFISADEKWMDEVEKAGAIDAKTRTNLLGNQLVLIAPVGKTFETKMEKGFDFAHALPANGRLALADPTHVPAGRYAQQALEWLGWWSAVEQRIVPAQDVRATLRLVENGEADAGVVYATDAKASSKVTVIAMFPAESHEPVCYPVALTAGAKPQAAEFLAFLQSDAMRRVFENAGFTVLTGER